MVKEWESTEVSSFDGDEELVDEMVLVVAGSSDSESSTGTPEFVDWTSPESWHGEGHNVSESGETSKSLFGIACICPSKTCMKSKDESPEERMTKKNSNAIVVASDSCNASEEMPVSHEDTKS